MTSELSRFSTHKALHQSLVPEKFEKEMFVFKFRSLKISKIGHFFTGSSFCGAHVSEI